MGRSTALKARPPEADQIVAKQRMQQMAMQMLQMMQTQQQQAMQPQMPQQPLPPQPGMSRPGPLEQSASAGGADQLLAQQPVLPPR